MKTNSVKSCSSLGSYTRGMQHSDHSNPSEVQKFLPSASEQKSCLAQLLTAITNARFGKLNTAVRVHGEEVKKNSLPEFLTLLSAAPLSCEVKSTKIGLLFFKEIRSRLSFGESCRFINFHPCFRANWPSSNQSFTMQATYRIPHIAFEAVSDSFLKSHPKHGKEKMSSTLPGPLFFKYSAGSCQTSHESSHSPSPLFWRSKSKDPQRIQKGK